MLGFDRVEMDNVFDVLVDAFGAVATGARDAAWRLDMSVSCMADVMGTALLDDFPEKTVTEIVAQVFRAVIRPWLACVHSW